MKIFPGASRGGVIIDPWTGCVMPAGFQPKHPAYLSLVACYFFLVAPAPILAARSMISKLAA